MNWAHIKKHAWWRGLTFGGRGDWCSLNGDFGRPGLSGCSGGRPSDLGCSVVNGMEAAQKPVTGEHHEDGHGVGVSVASVIFLQQVGGRGRERHANRIP